MFTSPTQFLLLDEEVEEEPSPSPDLVMPTVEEVIQQFVGGQTNSSKRRQTSGNVVSLKDKSTDKEIMMQKQFLANILSPNGSDTQAKKQETDIKDDIKSLQKKPKGPSVVAKRAQNFDKSTQNKAQSTAKPKNQASIKLSRKHSPIASLPSKKVEKFDIDIKSSALIAPKHKQATAKEAAATSNTARDEVVSAEVDPNFVKRGSDSKKRSPKQLEIVSSGDPDPNFIKQTSKAMVNLKSPIKTQPSLSVTSPNDNGFFTKTYLTNNTKQQGYPPSQSAASNISTDYSISSPVSTVADSAASSLQASPIRSVTPKKFNPKHFTHTLLMAGQPVMKTPETYDSTLTKLIFEEERLKSKTPSMSRHVSPGKQITQPSKSRESSKSAERRKDVDQGAGSTRARRTSGDVSYPAGKSSNQSSSSSTIQNKIKAKKSGKKLRQETAPQREEDQKNPPAVRPKPKIKIENDSTGRVLKVMGKGGGLTKSLSLDEDSFPTPNNLKSKSSNFLKVEGAPDDAPSPNGRYSRAKSRERIREQRERILGLSSSDEEPVKLTERKSPAPKTRKKLLKRSETLLGSGERKPNKKRYTRSKTEENFSPSFDPETHGQIIEVTHIPQQQITSPHSWRNKAAAERKDAFQNKVRAHRSMENLNSIDGDEEVEHNTIPIGDLITRFNERNKLGPSRKADNSDSEPKPKPKRLSWISDFFDKSKRSSSSAGDSKSSPLNGRGPRKMSEDMIKRKESLEDNLQIRKPKKKKYVRSKTVHLDHGNDEDDELFSPTSQDVLSPPRLRRSKTIDEYAQQPADVDKGDEEESIEQFHQNLRSFKKPTQNDKKRPARWRQSVELKLS